jgi:hypothetical protein
MWPFKNQSEWEYGTACVDGRKARRHRKRGNVQFVLWNAGEQGHIEDYWHDLDYSWWKTFKPSNAERNGERSESDCRAELAGRQTEET